APHGGTRHRLGDSPARRPGARSRACGSRSTHAHRSGRRRRCARRRRESASWVVDAGAHVSPVAYKPFYRSYAVLTMCRMRYTLQYGVVVSKPMAARWAQAAPDSRWTALIEAALGWSND